MRPLSRRSIVPAALLALLLPAAEAARAEGKPLPPPQSAAMPTVELTVEQSDGRPVCGPAELRLPAGSNIALHVVSRADQPVTITMPGQFENGHVLHADGDLVHVASEKGYTVKRNGQGTLRLRTAAAGEAPYACTGANRRDAPFVGRVVRAEPAG